MRTLVKETRKRKSKVKNTAEVSFFLHKPVNP
jgi:hypothetical protein